MNESIRLQKYLSQAWVCSRRKAEEFIRDWQVFINGKVAEIWMSVNPHIDTIVFWEKLLKNDQDLVYYKFYKPRWIETTCAQKWGTSIIDVVRTDQRVFPVWRLDKDSTWLILLTNDGRLTNYLTHPKYEHEKEYVVEVFWSIDDKKLDTMRQWVLILWKLTQPCTILRIASWKFSIILREWRNRQIRRMVESVWWKVKKLKRIRIGDILLWDMSVWELRSLSLQEVKSVRNIINIHTKDFS